MPEALIVRKVTLIHGNGAAPVVGAAIAIDGSPLSTQRSCWRMR